MRTLTIACALLLLAGCAARRQNPYPRGTRVFVSRGHAWEAAVAALRERNVDVREETEPTDRTIVSDAVKVDPNGERVADCRKALFLPDTPDAAIYTVMVVGDSSTTSVFASVLFSRLDPSTGIREPCQSRGIWEQRLESYIKLRAERMRQ